MNRQSSLRRLAGKFSALPLLLVAALSCRGGDGKDEPPVMEVPPGQQTEVQSSDPGDQGSNGREEAQSPVPSPSAGGSPQAGTGSSGTLVSNPPSRRELSLDSSNNLSETASFRYDSNASDGIDALMPAVFEVLIGSRDAAAPVNLSVGTVQARMTRLPIHGDTSKVVVKRIQGNLFEVSGLLLPIAGDWTIKISVAPRGGAPEELTIATVAR